MKRDSPWDWACFLTFFLNIKAAGTSNTATLAVAAAKDTASGGTSGASAINTVASIDVRTLSLNLNPPSSEPLPEYHIFEQKTLTDPSIHFQSTQTLFFSQP